MPMRVSRAVCGILLLIAGTVEGTQVKRQDTTANTLSSSSANTQTIACSNVATTTLSDAAAASSLAAACKTYTGSIALATGATDNIAFDGLEVLQGSLYADNVTQVVALTSDSLQTITDELYISGTVILQSFNFTQLGSVTNIEIICCTCAPGAVDLADASECQ